MIVWCKIYSYINGNKIPYVDRFILLDIPFTSNQIKIKKDENEETFEIFKTMFYLINSERGNKCMECILFRQEQDYSNPTKFIADIFIEIEPKNISYSKRMQFQTHEKPMEIRLCSFPIKRDYIFLKDKCYSLPDGIYYSDNEITAKANGYITINQFYELS